VLMLPTSIRESAVFCDDILFGCRNADKGIVSFKGKTS
jgi:hypothetical protein